MIFFLIVFVDLIFGTIIDKIYYHIPTKISYALKNCNEDIIVIGSSRAEMCFNPAIITDSTNLSCYNLAVGGQNIYYYYGILNTVLSHKIPKIVLMDITSIDYNNTPGWNTEKISMLYPLYNHIDTVRNLINSADYFNRYRLFLKTRQFNSTLFTILVANYVDSRHKSDFINGYKPSIDKNQKEINRSSNSHCKLDKGKLLLIAKFCRICDDNKIKLIITSSPQFTILGEKDQNLREISDILKELGCKYWNYSQDTSIINHKDFFRDPAHLNRFGAEKYSQLIAHRLKAELTVDN